MDRTMLRTAVRTLASCLLAEVASGLHTVELRFWRLAERTLPHDPERPRVDPLDEAIERNAALFDFDPADAADVIRRRQGLRPVREQRP